MNSGAYDVAVRTAKRWVSAGGAREPLVVFDLRLFSVFYSNFKITLYTPIGDIALRS